MSKYLKSINYEGLIVKFVSPQDEECFYGFVVSQGNSHWVASNNESSWVSEYFEPYTPTPQELIEWGETATLSNDNPSKVEADDKDVNLRLKCLELAIMGYNTDAIDKANDFYEWITKKPNS